MSRPSSPSSVYAPILTLAQSIVPADSQAKQRATERQQQLTKPLGALGVLEALSIQLAGIFGQECPELGKAAVLVAAADHGISTEGVSAYPSAVTQAMVHNFLATTPHGQGGAAISAIARALGIQVYIINAGVAGTLPEHPTLIDVSVRAGTRHFGQQAAMTPEELLALVQAGARVAHQAIAEGADMLIAGEMGIGNTCSAAAMTARLLGRSVAEVTGRGTGIDDATLSKKQAIIMQALQRSQCTEPLEVLREFGGYEIAFMLGVMLEVAAQRKVLVLDGFVEGAAALVAQRLSACFTDYLVAAGECAEQGHAAQLSALGKKPHFHLGLRLGEGTGGALMVPMLRAAAATLREMQTFAEAGVPESSRP